MGLLDFFRKKKEKPVEQRSGNQTKTRGHRPVPRTPTQNVNKPHAGTKPAATQSRDYTVKAGDSLSRIAKEFYGNANEWQKIYQANRNRIKDPNVIHPGQKIVIP